MHKVITLTTDFGSGEYVAAMKGVILSINPHVRIIDVSHTIKPQEVLEGAYVLYSTAQYFTQAIHVGVVDPGVGTERAGLLIQCENGFLVGPDNGLLVPCARKLGLTRVYKITNKSYLLDDVSYTFHGRDIFAPVAAHLSKGVEPKEIGEAMDDYEDLNLEYHEEKENMLEGKVIHVDSFGNLITSLTKEIVKRYIKFGSTVEIEMETGRERQKRKVHFLKSYGHAESRELLATISSSGLFEISQNQGSAQEIFKAGPGSIVRLHF
jgi:S-adenosylmethionine hydrolase